jgi:hypothetical protein
VNETKIINKDKCNRYCGRVLHLRCCRRSWWANCWWMAPGNSSQSEEPSSDSLTGLGASAVSSVFTVHIPTVLPFLHLLNMSKISNDLISYTNKIKILYSNIQLIIINMKTDSYLVISHAHIIWPVHITWHLTSSLTQM